MLLSGSPSSICTITRNSIEPGKMCYVSAYKGSFTYYVINILEIFTPPPPSVINRNQGPTPPPPPPPPIKRNQGLTTPPPPSTLLYVSFYPDHFEPKIFFRCSSKIFEVKIFSNKIKVFLETTCVHVSCYPDHYESKIFFRFSKSATRTTLRYTILDSRFPP